MNLVQVQEHLKGMPTQAVMAYANGQNPQVPPYIALGELNRRKQMEQPQAQPATGSVKEQIEQSLMQPQQLPGLAAQGVPVPQQPQPQGIPSQMPQQLAGAAPQQAPTKMAGGGLASVPVRDGMFNYAPGGIVAFDEGGDVDLPLPEEYRVEGLERGTRYRDEMEKARGKKSEDKEADKGDEKVSDIMKALAFASAPVAALADVAASPINALRNIVRNPLDRSERPSMTPMSDARQRLLYGDQGLPSVAPTAAAEAEAPAVERGRPTMANDPRIQAMMAAAQQEAPTGIAGIPGAARVSGTGGAGGAGVSGGASAGRLSSGVGGGGANDALSFLRAQMNAPEQTYKTRADYMAEAAKTNPELLAKPEEGMRAALAELIKSQQAGRQRAMEAEGRQGLADLSNALIAAGEATRGQRGSGLGVAFGGFGKSYNAATAAAAERQAKRDELQQQQDLNMAKLQYEITEKSRARAAGDVDAEMKHDAKIAELKDKVRDDKIKAANYLAQDARTREANASSAELRREQIAALRENKPSAEDKLLTTVMSRVNSDPAIKGLADAIKQGSVQPGTAEYNKLIQNISVLSAPYYKAAGLQPPPAAELMEEAAAPSKKGFWASLFGGNETPAPAKTTIPEGWSVKKNP